MRLSLVRHAETTEDARRRCYGRLDVGLSARGRTQCESLAEWFRHEPVGGVVASPAIRARETAAAIAAPHGLTVEVADSLRELDFGELEGRRYDEIAQSDPELYERWMSAPTTVRFPGGESYADLEARAADAIATLVRHPSGRSVVVVTHGGVIRAVLRSVLGFPAEHLFRIAVDPASVTTVEWVEGEPIIRGLNRTT
jgi:alpha-ribazole phosphatase/probable phosphoglycerate mutase